MSAASENKAIYNVICA